MDHEVLTKIIETAWDHGDATGDGGDVKRDLEDALREVFGILTPDQIEHMKKWADDPINLWPFGLDGSNPTETA